MQPCEIRLLIINPALPLGFTLPLLLLLGYLAPQGISPLILLPFGAGDRCNRGKTPRPSSRPLLTDRYPPFPSFALAHPPPAAATHPSLHFLGSHLPYWLRCDAPDLLRWPGSPAIHPGQLARPAGSLDFRFVFPLFFCHCSIEHHYSNPLADLQPTIRSRSPGIARSFPSCIHAPDPSRAGTAPNIALNAVSTPTRHPSSPALQFLHETVNWVARN